MSKKTKVSKINSNYVEKYDAYMERQKKRKKRLIRRMLFVGAVLTFLIGSLTVYHMKQRTVHADMLEEYNQLQEELSLLQQVGEEYEEEIHLLKDESYILDIARTNYFLSKKGELIFKIPDEDPSY